MRLVIHGVPVPVGTGAGVGVAVSGGGEIGDREHDFLGEVGGRFDVVGVVSGTVLSGIDAVGN